MKKLISLFLALVLCLSVASALATESPKTSDQYEVSEKFEIVTESELAEDVLEMLKVDDVNEFFGDVQIGDGETATLTEMLGTDDITVEECVGFAYEGDAEEPEEVTFVVPTKYAADEKVVVIIGVLVGDEIVWYAFEATVSENYEVTFELPVEVLEAMKGNDCVVAIASAA